MLLFTDGISICITSWEFSSLASHPSYATSGSLFLANTSRFYVWLTRDGFEQNGISCIQQELQSPSTKNKKVQHLSRRHLVVDSTSWLCLVLSLLCSSWLSPFIHPFVEIIIEEEGSRSSPVLAFSDIWNTSLAAGSRSHFFRLNLTHLHGSASWLRQEGEHRQIPAIILPKKN